MYRGSCKQFLDWVVRREFASARLLLARPVICCLRPDSVWKPRGMSEAAEDRLERFGPEAMPSRPVAAAIEEARRGPCCALVGIAISHDTHYQLSNRLAFAWRLATLGIPTSLVYLGFTGDEGIRNVGEPFASD